MGLAAVAWAFDPLQATNAAFNLAVLGATSRCYEVDLYGPRTDALNAGLATDRLLVEWPTDGEPVGSTTPWADGAELVELRDGEPVARSLPRAARHLHLRIPPGPSTLKRMDGARARAWQHSVRAAFRAAFAAGFVAVGFARGDEEHPPRYLLARPER